MRPLALVGMAALLYGLAACSNTPGDLKPLAKGGMAKLEITAKPETAPDIPFKDGAGGSHILGEFKGKVTIVNLWANWCAPCKEEIPSLARLQTAYAGKDVAVVATGHTAPLMLPECHTVEHYDKHLTLEGLRMVYERNQDGQRGRAKADR